MGPVSTASDIPGVPRGFLSRELGRERVSRPFWRPSQAGEQPAACRAGRKPPVPRAGASLRGMRRVQQPQVPRVSFMSIKSKVIAAAAALTLIGGVGTAGVLGAEPRAQQRRRAAPAASTSSASSSAPTRRRTTRLTCSNKASGPTSRSSCSGPRTTTRRWTGARPSRAPWPTSTRPAWCRRRWRCTTAASGDSAGHELPACGQPARGRSRTTRRSKSNTRRSAWTAACAWAWPGGDQRRGRDVAAVRHIGADGLGRRPVRLDPARPIRSEYVPLINGSDANFSQPFVLTYPANGFPTNMPRPQFTVANLTGFSQSSPPF